MAVGAPQNGVARPQPRSRRGARSWTSRHRVAVYVAKRLAVGLVLVWIVSVVAFAATQLLPGDAASAKLGRGATAEQLSTVRASLGLDRPVIERYGDWVGGVVRGDLGVSYTADVDVAELVGPRALNSAVLALFAAALIIPLSLVVGAYAGWKTGGWIDHTISIWALVFLAVPEFVTGAVLAYVFGVSLGLFPPVALLPSGAEPWMHPDVLVLPIATLMLAAMPYGVWYVRAAVVASLDTEYVHMARLNGVAERRILWRYALRNALAPSIQVITLILLYLVGGIVVVESVFNYPGLGLLAVDATQNRDTPTVQAIVVIIGTAYVLFTVLNDLLTVLVTPKMRTTL